MPRPQTGKHTVVTVEVSRGNLPLFSAAILRQTGLDLAAITPDCVYFPAGSGAFGVITGATGKPGGGVFGELNESQAAPIRTSAGTFCSVKLARLGRYFGWAARSVRIEFASHDGETYLVTLSYELLAGHSEDWRLVLLDVVLRHGSNSYSKALTARAADQFANRIARLELPQTL